MLLKASIRTIYFLCCSVVKQMQFLSWLNIDLGTVNVLKTIFKLYCWPWCTIKFASDKNNFLHCDSHCVHTILSQVCIDTEKRFSFSKYFTDVIVDPLHILLFLCQLYLLLWKEQVLCHQYQYFAFAVCHFVVFVQNKKRERRKSTPFHFWKLY